MSPDAALEPARDRPFLAVADAADREVVYRIRHDVYAEELGQHATNAEHRLTDALDAHNVYIVARRGDDLLGFVSLTAPTSPSYSIDKYVARAELPFAFDAGLWEARLLTVVAGSRRGMTAGALLYAALRWIDAHGGTAIEALGRREVVPLYEKVGFRRVGRQIASGRVVYEVLHQTIEEARGGAVANAEATSRVEREFDWRLPMPFRAAAVAYHGGAFFDAIGDTFGTLERRRDVLNADVLDAWFPPSPRAVAAVAEHLEWLLRTSPPTGCEGLIRTIGEVRGVPAASVLPGGGSSELMYLALRRWMKPGDRVLLPDPTYGEYAHLLGRVIGCHVERLPLSRAEGWRLDPQRLADALAASSYALVVLVNPNSPTGRHVPRAALEPVLAAAPATTRFWVDETYVDYANAVSADGEESLERFAAASANVVVCKSMSKAYALSGARCAYLCAPPRLVEDLRTLTPPWAVGLVGQVAAVEALHDRAWYEARWRDTARLREDLARELAATLRAEVVPSVTNFLLLHLPADGPSPTALVSRCRERGLYLRAFPDSPLLSADAVRVAVKDAETNARMVAILRESVGAT